VLRKTQPQKKRNPPRVTMPREGGREGGKEGRREDEKNMNKVRREGGRESKDLPSSSGSRLKKRLQVSAELRAKKPT